MSAKRELKNIVIEDFEIIDNKIEIGWFDKSEDELECYYHNIDAAKFAKENSDDCIIDKDDISKSTMSFKCESHDIQAGNYKSDSWEEETTLEEYLVSNINVLKDYIPLSKPKTSSELLNEAFSKIH